MSSDGEDYDGDTNWDEIAAIRDTLSPRRPRAQPSAPSGISPTRSLSRPPERSDIVVVQDQIQSSGSGAPTFRTGRVLNTATPTPAVAQGNGANGRSGSVSRSHDNRRVQNIICMGSSPCMVLPNSPPTLVKSKAALTSDFNDNPKKEGESSSANLSKGKRKRSNDDIEVVRKNKPSHVKDSRPSEEVQKALNGYDEELSCPICLDFFLAPQLLNPCGHTVCGDCLDHLLSKSNRQCPTCRANLSYPSTHFPNYAIGGTVDRYIELQRANNDPGWLEGGAKWKERQSRKRTYEVVKEMKKTQVQRPAVYRPSAESFGMTPEHFRMYFYTESRADPPPPPAGRRRARVVQPAHQEIIQISSDNEEDEWSA